MWYHVDMALTNQTDSLRPRNSPEDISVQLNLRVPYHYRETLTAEAERQHISINRLIVNALVTVIPPEQ